MELQTFVEVSQVIETAAQHIHGDFASLLILEEFGAEEEPLHKLYCLLVFLGFVVQYGHAEGHMSFFLDVIYFYPSLRFVLDLLQFFNCIAFGSCLRVHVVNISLILPWN